MNKRCRIDLSRTLYNKLKTEVLTANTKEQVIKGELALFPKATIESYLAVKTIEPI